MSIRQLMQRAGEGILILAALLTTSLSQAAGLLQPADGSLPPLEIRDHQVEVVIEDSYAVTQVEQVFFNPHDRDLEAHYSFPVPEHGSVAEFTLWIDGQPVTGEVLEKKEDPIMNDRVGELNLKLNKNLERIFNNLIEEGECYYLKTSIPKKYPNYDYEKEYAIRVGGVGNCLGVGEAKHVKLNLFSENNNEVEISFYGGKL